VHLVLQSDGPDGTLVNTQYLYARWIT
jgi:hypothetical protein